jgi:hypothetical protein
MCMTELCKSMSELADACLTTWPEAQSLVLPVPSGLMCMSECFVKVFEILADCIASLSTSGGHADLGLREPVAVMAIESSAVFKSRATAMGLVQADIDALEAKGWSSFSTFAFASSYIPGQGDDSAFKRDVVAAILGTDTHVRASVLRRLYFEAYTLTAADLRSRVERTGEDPPRKMPGPERTSRIKDLKARFSGLSFSDRYEPAHHLIDSFAQMVEEGSLKFICWSHYASRADELKGTKLIKRWSPDANGNLKEVVSSEHSTTVISGDLLLMQAFHRRGAAMDIAKLLDFGTHDELVKMYFRELQRDQPPGYSCITHDQILRADKEIFRILEEKTPDGLSIDMSGRKPLTALLKSVSESGEIRLLLLPLPARTKLPVAAKVNPDTGLPVAPTLSKRAAKKVRQVALKEKAAKATATTASIAKGKGKGKGSGVRLPKGLEGTSSTPAGEAICFGFNLQTCSETGASCSRGLHVCTKCYKGHAFRICRE